MAQQVQTKSHVASLNSAYIVAEIFIKSFLLTSPKKVYDRGSTISSY